MSMYNIFNVLQTKNKHKIITFVVMNASLGIPLHKNLFILKKQPASTTSLNLVIEETIQALSASPSYTSIISSNLFRLHS